MSYEILIPYCVALGCLITATIFDVKTRRIPNALTFPMILCGLLLSIFLRPDALYMSVIGIIISFFFSFIPGIGMGDIKLIMGLCFYINPIHVMLAFALASILVVVKHLIKNPKSLNMFIMTLYLGMLTNPEKKVPSNSVVFAPYLLISTVIIEGATYLWPILSSL